MRTFLLKAFAFVLIQGLLFGMIYCRGNGGSSSYLAASLDKHERLRTLRGPRVILVGGSNLAFGINSDTLEHELGMPIVNMGLHQKLGLDYLLNEVEADLQPGDVIVLSLEYGIFVEPKRDLLRAQIIEARPSSLLDFPVSSWKSLLDRHGFSILGGIARHSLARVLSHENEYHENSYRRSGFDPQGSYTAHYGKPPVSPDFSEDRVTAIAPEFHARLRRFVELCAQREVRCFFSCPPHPEELLRPVPKLIRHNMESLKKIPGLVVLDSPEDHLYRMSDFFDSAYHLSEKGARERTRRMAASLRNALRGSVLASGR